MDGKAPRTFTLQEVQRHMQEVKKQDPTSKETKRECWLVIHGKVYDVTGYLDDHPGGGDVLISATGSDATDAFEDVGHSSSARKILQDFYIGDLRESSGADQDPGDSHDLPAPMKVDKTETSLLTKVLQVLVPLAILAFAVAVRLLTKNEQVVAST